MFISWNQTFAQATSIRILSEPQNNYGYLIWDIDHPDVAYFNLEIHKVTINGTDTADVTESRTEVWGKRYYKLPRSLVNYQSTNSYYYVQLNALNASHQQVAALYRTLTGDGVGVVGCHWECKSSEYAYRIEQVAFNGANNYRMARTYALNDPEFNVIIPYYRYFTPDGFNDFTSPVNDPMSWWHHHPDWTRVTVDNIEMGNIIDHKIHTKFNQQNNSYTTYRDALGHVIDTDVVYGLGMGWGPWYYMNGVTGVVAINGLTTDHCAQSGGTTLSFMRELFNEDTDLNVNPDIICPPDLSAGLTFGEELWTPPYDVSYPNWLTSFGKPSPKGDPTGENEDPTDSTSTSIQNEIIYINESNWHRLIADAFGAGLTGTEEEKFAAVLADAELFSLTRFTESPQSMVNGSFSSFFDSLGTPVFPAISFDQGLYTLTIKRSDYSLFFVTFEVDERFTATLPLESFFQATIYPNPHSGSNYSGHVTTTAALNVHYQLFDNVGNVVLTRNFALPKDHDGHHQVAPPGGTLPSGFLYHKFTFDDGSFKTYTTYNP